MADVSIKVKIADRDYPMRVSETDVDKIMLAAKLLQEKLNTFKQKFKVDDKQDLLAMVAFDNFVEKIQEKEIPKVTDTNELSEKEIFIQKISELNKLVSSVLE